VVILVAAAPLLLMPFGGDYAREGTDLLRLCAAASLFRAVLFLFIALKRLEGRGRPSLVSSAADFILLIGLSVILGPALGLAGIGLAWLISNAVVGLAVAPSLWRALRGAEPATDG